MNYLASASRFLEVEETQPAKTDLNKRSLAWHRTVRTLKYKSQRIKLKFPRLFFRFNVALESYLLMVFRVFVRLLFKYILAGCVLELFLVLCRVPTNQHEAANPLGGYPFDAMQWNKIYVESCRSL